MLAIKITSQVSKIENLKKNKTKDINRLLSGAP